MRQSSGFTAIELLIYVAIFSILALSFSSIFVSFTRVNVDQLARNEVASQLNFILQTIQNAVQNSSFVTVRSTIDDVGGTFDEIDSSLGSPMKYLVMKRGVENSGTNDAESPLVIYKDNDGSIVMRQGRGTLQTTSKLTTDRVSANTLTFVKLNNSPGRNIIEINLVLNSLSNQGQQISRTLLLGVGEAFAAIFDTDLLPATDNLSSLGQSTKQWKEGHFSGDVTAGTLTVGGGTKITTTYYGTIAVDPPSIPAGSTAVVNIPLATTGRVFLTPPHNIEPDLVFMGAVYNFGTNNIDILIRNLNTVSTVDGVARSWYYFQIK